jgi:hypothetical protein
MLELTSLAVGFTLPHTRTAAAPPRSTTVVADAAVLSILAADQLPAVLGGAAALALGSAYAFTSKDEAPAAALDFAPAAATPSSSTPSTSSTAEMSSLDGVVVPANKPPPVQVLSWYDYGVRLALPVQSWYDRGQRLNDVISWYDAGLRLQWRQIPLQDIIIHEPLGVGTQSEVLLGELPNGGDVAVKLGLKRGAIAREAAVLAKMSGIPGFPTLLHWEPEGAIAPGGSLVIGLLGRSLEEMMKSLRKPPPDADAPPTSSTPAPPATRMRLSDTMLLRVGRGCLRLLERLHLAGFVHNDLKPANLLLGDTMDSKEPTRLHLIDFGSCTPRCDPDDPPPLGPIGTAMFASVAADECVRPMRPADDLESLAYNLAYLATGTLPWQGKPDSVATALKRELLTGKGEAAEGGLALAAGLEPASPAATALRALWAEVRRCYCDEPVGGVQMGIVEACLDGMPEGMFVDYEACLRALGGGAEEETGTDAEEADPLSEFSFMAAYGCLGGDEASKAGAVSHAPGLQDSV